MDPDSKLDIPPRIFLWCVPRSCSTVFTKMMSFVDGAEIWFEPYTISLFHKFEDLPRGNDRDAKPSSNNVVSNLRHRTTFSNESTKKLLEGPPLNPNAKFIFIKDMAYAIDNLYEFLPEQVPCKHVFLIRHPYRFLPSWRNLMKILSKLSPSDEFKHDETSDLFIRGDEGTDQIYALWKHVRQKVDPNPIVIDSDVLLNKRGDILPKFFDRLGIPWKDSYLNWPGETDVVESWITSFIAVNLDDRVHGKAFSSSHLDYSKKPLPNFDEIHPDIAKYLDRFMPGYEEMYNYVLR